MKKKLLALILMGALAVSSLVACGGNGAGNGDELTDSGKRVLTLWSTYTEASNIKLSILDIFFAGRKVPSV